jgi:hypothetical protein
MNEGKIDLRDYWLSDRLYWALSEVHKGAGRMVHSRTLDIIERRGLIRKSGDFTLSPLGAWVLASSRAGFARGCKQHQRPTRRR